MIQTNFISVVCYNKTFSCIIFLKQNKTRYPFSGCEIVAVLKRALHHPCSFSFGSEAMVQVKAPFKIRT